MAKPKAKSKSSNKRGGQAPPTQVVERTIPIQGMRLINRELIATVTLPTTKDGVASGSFMLVPAKLAWLVNVASSFQSYCWHHVRAIYSPMVGDNNPGMVALGRSHDLNDKVPTTLANMAAQAGSSIGRVSLGCANTVEHTLGRTLSSSCIGFDLPRKELLRIGCGGKLDYITSATLDGLSVDGKDRHVDLVVQWLTVGGAGTGEAVGYLWVHYEVELFSPTPYGSNY